MVQFEKTALDNVLLIKPEIYEDFRGEIVETWNNKVYKEFLPLDIKFVCDKISVSQKNVFRGIHSDNITWKLISCLYGKIYLIVLNYDRQSEQYGKWISLILNNRNRHQVLVPPKFGNGHLVLSEKAIFHYKWSEYYDLSKQFTIKWNDPRFNIKLPVSKDRLILSERDSPDSSERDSPDSQKENFCNKIETKFCNY